MNTGGRAARALVAVAVVAGLVGCTGSRAESPQATVPSTTTTRPLMFEDTGLRDVRMTSGRALRFVHTGTASQILCQLLDKGEWEELLDGPVGRKPTGPPAVCQIAFSGGVMRIDMTSAHDSYQADTTIAGRPAATSRRGDGYAVALTDDAFEFPTDLALEAKVLSVDVVADDEDVAQDVARAVLDELVPLVLEEGDPMPDIDEDGYVRYERTPLTKDFGDRPTPVQALQLCTFGQEELGLDVTDVVIHYIGECRIDAADNVTLSTEAASTVSGFPDRVAGRPANISEDPAAVRVLLRDDAGTVVRVVAEDAVGIAEKLVQELVR